MSAQFLFYTFDNSTTGTPGTTRLQLDVAFPYNSASLVRVHKQTDGGADAKYLWLAVPVGATLYLQDKNDSDIVHQFTVVAEAVEVGTYLDVAVRWEASLGAALANNQPIAVVLKEPAAVTPTPEPEEPTPPYDFSHVEIAAPLVALATVKQHLRITDTVHDEDVTQKLLAAQDQILAKLAYAADPLWSESTLPRNVQHAILLLTSTLYEVRGGEDQAENFRKAWAAIDLLLALYRDPALA